MISNQNPRNYWTPTLNELYKDLNTTAEGLSTKKAEEKLATLGLNQIVKEEKFPPALHILISQFKSSLILILLAAAAISFFQQQDIDAIIVVSLVALSVLFGFFQEYKAEETLGKLKKFISQSIIVKRDNEWTKIDSRNLTVGDIVKLQIGDLIAADMRLITSDDLSTNESVLTGESIPVSKEAKELKLSTPQPQELKNTVFMGSNVSGGYGEAVVVATGNNTYFGQTISYIEKTAPETDFQKATRKFSGFLFKIIAVMTVFVFIANTIQGKGAFDSFYFAIALAVGITPELLPAIMTVTLSQGAMKMAEKKVVVKRLMSVEDLGNIDTLCTDKTGTLTSGIFSLNNYLDVSGKKDSDILVKGLICTSNFASRKATSSSNAIDQALWETADLKDAQKHLDEYKYLDANEFDYKRRRMSVLVEKDGKKLFVVKGAPDSVFETTTLSSKKRSELLKKVDDYENDGFRVIALAQSEWTKKTSHKEDEKGLEFMGFLLFNDPVKPDAKESIELLQKLGVGLKILSGDSAVVTISVAKTLGFNVTKDQIITGDALIGISEKEISEIAAKYTYFARVTPEQKYAIVSSLNKDGHIVGFLGDGVNDAPAIKAADVGISVNTAAAVAQEAADIVLLEKDLTVLAHGIEMGRRTFANIMKYILNTISANFGNMFTMAASSIFLSFIPLLPKQILLTNFISDIPLFTIATDNVDSNFTRKPKRWNIKLIGQFMLYFGLISSLFDLALILPMAYLWHLPPGTFRTAWYIESTISEILITFAIRTKLPFYKSMPSHMLIWSSLLSCLLIVVVPFLAFGQSLFEFTMLPGYLWFWIGFILCGYLLVAELVKHVFFDKYEL